MVIEIFLGLLNEKNDSTFVNTKESPIRKKKVSPGTQRDSLLSNRGSLTAFHLHGFLRQERSRWQNTLILDRTSDKITNDQ